MDHPPDRRILFLALLLAAGLGGLAACFPSADPDLWFHLALGRQMVQEGLPDTERLCVLSQGRPFTNHEWLWDLGIYGLWQAGGLPAVLAGRVVSAALLFALSAALALGLGARPLVALGVLALAVPVVRPWLGDRPHGMAYALAAAVTLLTLSRTPVGWRRLAGFFLLVALWANIHGSFPVAIPLVALPLVHRETRGDARSRRSWLAAGVLVVLATFLNPWGPRLYGTVVHHGGAVYRVLSEWAPWDFAADPARDLALVLLVGGAVAGFLGPSRRRALTELLLLVLFLIPFGRAEKFAPGLLVGAVPVLAVHLSSLPLARSWLVRLGALVLLPALVVFSRPGPVLHLSLDMQEMPTEAMVFAREAGIRGPVFHPFNAGGHVAFFGHPEIRPILDGRIYIHGAEGLQAYLDALASEERFQDLMRRHGLQGVLVDRQDASFQGLITRLQGDGRYGLFWLDDRFAWFLPRDFPAPPFRVLRAVTDPRYLLFLDADQARLAEEEVGRVLESDRGVETQALVRGMLALRQAGMSWEPEGVFRPGTDRDGCLAAAAHLGKVARLRPDVPMFGYFEGLALTCGGRCQEALEVLRRARAFPDARALLHLLRQSGCPGQDHPAMP